MTTKLYDAGRDAFLQGALQWKASGGHIFRAFLVTAAYSPTLATDAFLSAIPTNTRFGNNGLSARGNAPSLKTSTPGAGVADASTIVFTAVPSGNICVAIVIFRDDGVADASSQLVAYIDNPTGLPVMTNGADIVVAWDTGINRIFKL